MYLRKAQSTLEFTLVCIVILGAFVAMSGYIKRGIQGRWRAAVDDLGDQYDPLVANSTINYTTTGSTDTRISLINRINGYVTLRTDVSESEERKTGSITVGGY